MGGEGDSSEATTFGVGAQAETGKELATVRCSNGAKFSVQTALGSTVGAFKAVVAQNCDVPADQQRLIYKGRILKDDQALDSYGLQADHTVHMVSGFTASATTTTPITANLTTNDAPANAVRSVPANEAGGLGGADLGASLFPGPGLGGLGGNGWSALFGAGFPEFEQVQQQLTQNPNMMQEIMNMPAMQSLMNNPDLMRTLIMSNPHMREIIDRNPELAHILNDPSILRQILETARNPELRREMMRNTDRAMSNIESSPEGFNMLRCMYENVQEPFLNATTMAGDAENNLSSNPFAALLGNQGGGQQRTGSNNLSTTGSDPNAGAIPNTNPLPNPWTPSGETQTNSTPRSNPVGDIRPPSLGGDSGLGSALPDLDRMLLGDGAQNSAQFTQLLQNPAISQMIQSLLSNPQYMNQILNTSPQLRAISEMNPQFREMMRNPDTLRQLSSPDTMQQMLTLMSQLNRQSNQVPSQTGVTTGNTNTNNMNLEMLMNMLGGLGTGSGLGVPANPNGPPEELYATQLSQLQEMGFFDTQENIRALQATRGNVNAAVERLLNPGL